jgi:hypothetical protein
MLTRPTKKEKIIWNDKVKEAFKKSKEFFTSSLVLEHVDITKPLFLEGNALDITLRNAPFCYREGRNFQPITFHFHIFSCINQLLDLQ